MRHPSLYQINTRVVLGERGAELGRRASFDDFPDAALDDIAAKGFEWVWFLGVWQTGEAARQVSRTNPSLRSEFKHELPDLREEDITGSPFAVVAWDVHRDFGGDPALARLRERLARRGLKLLLDFVPNHVAPDHPWVQSHPEYFIRGTEEDLAREPHNYVRLKTGKGSMILAYGRDPYFAGWPDTLQLNYRHAGFREAQIAELGRIAERCDAVRCDMAMLVQPEIFQRTWGERARPADGSPPKDPPFWPEAIATVRRRRAEFMFVAEVYWDMEWELQQAGFDYTYDKRLYDRLVARQARPVREHLMADPGYQARSLRFLENHDEPRAAATFEEPALRAAAAITFFVPGMRFFHEGQLEGRKVHVSMHLGRRPKEPVNQALKAFYDKLLAALRRPEAHEGEWRQWACRQAWQGNPTHDQFIVMTWDGGDRRLLVVSNYGPSPGQCYVTLAIPALAGKHFTLVDQLSDARFDREGDGLVGNGLYLDVPAWGHHVFDVQEVER
jgi:glycosidase